jgi:hypothetical protein
VYEIIGKIFFLASSSSIGATTLCGFWPAYIFFSSCFIFEGLP